MSLQEALAVIRGEQVQPGSRKQRQKQGTKNSNAMPTVDMFLATCTSEELATMKRRIEADLEEYDAYVQAMKERDDDGAGDN